MKHNNAAGLDDRFWSKVDQSGECWMWQGSLMHGYGVVRLKRDAEGKQKKRRAHRIAYELTIGPIPNGLMLDHRCRNRACVNPSHLRPVTAKQNNENRIARPQTESGYRGVTRGYWGRSWRVEVGHNGKKFRAGPFATEHEAALVAQRMRNELHTHNDADRVA